jgi:hypothetical protein
MSIFRFPSPCFRHLRHLALVATVMGLMSCSEEEDKMCSSSPYAAMDARLDSAVWTYRVGDSALRGRIAGADESRIRSGIEGGWNTWTPRQTIRPYVSELSGQVVVGGRLGHRDTLVYYAVDSVGVLAEDRRKAGIRLQFRSTLSTTEGTYYGLHAIQGGGDSLSTYWNLRGQVECTMPLDAGLEQEKSVSCSLRATSPDGLAFHMTLGVVHHGPSEYKCSGMIVD